MSPALAFTLANAAVLPVWAVWIAAPRSAAAGRLAAHALPVLALCVLYAVLLGAALASGPPVGLGFEGMRAALGAPLGFLAGWVHYLALDLFTGAWVLREARRLDLEPRPYLLLTLLVGPLGLGSFLVRRAALLRSLAQVGEVDLA